MSGERESSITYAEGGVGLGDCTNDVNVLEQGHPSRGSELSCGPNQPLHPGDGDPRFAGRQHHHYGLDVWYGNARVFSETSAKSRAKQRENYWCNRCIDM